MSPPAPPRTGSAREEAGLILPPLASVARAHGFASLEAARARGLEARAARAAAARGRDAQLEEEPFG